LPLAPNEPLTVVCVAGPPPLVSLLRNRLSAHQHREKERLYKEQLEAYVAKLISERDALRYGVVGGAGVGRGCHVEGTRVWPDWLGVPSPPQGP
jgi:hypothetical protein